VHDLSSIILVLIYMSIRTIIKGHCDDKDKALYAVNPRMPHDPIVRHLFTFPEVNAMLVGPWKDQAEENEWQAANAILERFVAGDILPVKVGRRDSRSKRGAPLGHLEPLAEGVWSIRAMTAGNPGIRILGQFGEKDLFIALTYGEREFLGEGFADFFNTIPWDDLIRTCKARWRNLFPSYPPVTGADSNDYITNILL
jgi:hypothetical protein